MKNRFYKNNSRNSLIRAYGEITRLPKEDIMEFLALNGVRVHRGMNLKRAVRNTLIEMGYWED